MFRDLLDDLERRELGGLDGFTRSFVNFGAHIRGDGSMVWHKWCPGAQAFRLISIKNHF